MYKMSVCYASDKKDIGWYRVTFVVNATGERLTRGFDSESQARVFVNKLKHSKRCTVTSYPLFK
jgi:hypothetical protein